MCKDPWEFESEAGVNRAPASLGFYCHVVPKGTAHALHLLLSLQVNVGAGSHPNKVKVYGPGVAKTGLKAHEPTYFTVDCAEAGQGKDQPVGSVGQAGRWGSPGVPCSAPVPS